MVKDIAKWLKKILNRDGLEKIERAVQNAESLTSAEIVPMIVKSSITTGHVPVIAFCLLFILFMCSGLSDIQAEYLTTSPFWLLLDVAIFSFCAIWLSKISFVKRQLTSCEDIAAQVNQRAELEFYEAELNSTRGNTGVLIFLSLVERRVVVLADKAISEKYDGSTWDGLVEVLLDGVKKKDLAEGFCGAIERCGEILSPHFPRSSDDRNELRDHLIIKD